MRWNVARAAASGNAVGERIAFFGTAGCHVDTAGVVSLVDGRTVVRISNDGLDVDVRTDDARRAEPTLAVAFHFALERQGRFHLHAAGLVQSDGTGLLLCAGSGSGKTTAVLSLLDHAPELQFLSDDTVYLVPDAGGIGALGLPATFHVTERTLRIFPHLQRHTRGPVLGNVPKVALEPREAYAGRERALVRRIGRLLFPELGDGKTRVEALSPQESFVRLLGSSGLGLLPLPDRDRHLDALVLLAETAAGAKLVLGADAERTPSCVPDAVLGR